MPNNGFARDNEFRAEKLTDDIAQFTLEDTPQFREKYYPYGFILTVTYTLHENGYTARAEVTAKEDLYYTFAWHPAFSLDINGRGCDLETYTLSFEQNEHCGEHGVTAGLGDMTTFVAWTQQKRHGQFLCLEPMVSFGFADRPLEIERMEETRLLEKDHSEVWENTFTVF